MIFTPDLISPHLDKEFSCELILVRMALEQYWNEVVMSMNGIQLVGLSTMLRRNISSYKVRDGSNSVCSLIFTWT